MEEITEVMSKVVLGHLNAPCIVYNLNGYYEGLKGLLSTMVKNELAFPDRLARIDFAAEIEEIKQIIGRNVNESRT